jgi:spermidine/putrescine ABC transporter ATP-binding subunit
MKYVDQKSLSSARSLEASISLRGLWKTYGDFVAVRGIDLTVGEGEFCTMLGPSGSGKTTALMMIAGFVMPTKGNIVVAGRDLTYVPPQKRDLGIVFQNYALFPHMSVRQNVAFPLEMRRIPKGEIVEKTERILKLVELTQFADRLPRQLSGGQQQRVALARALVFEPKVLLMDEPLGALDKQLRTHLQLELKRLQRRLNVTVIYVTHDQEEALTMADRIVIMKDGRIEQNATPEDVYDRPRTTFVATFIGETNLLQGTLTETKAGTAQIELPTGRKVLATVEDNTIRPGDRAVASVRPERILLTSKLPADSSNNCWDGRVREVTYLGDSIRYHVIVDEGRPSLAQTLMVKEPRTARPVPLGIGEEVFAHWPIEHTRVLVTDSA